MLSRQIYIHQNTSLPMQLFFQPRFTAASHGPVWMLIKGYVNKLCGETPTDLRMGIPANVTNFDGYCVTLTET
jgi:hypothetical protein